MISDTSNRALVIIVAGGLGLAVQANASRVEKSTHSTDAAHPVKRINAKTQDDLPRRSYAITGNAEDLLASDDATFDEWAAKVAADADLTLREYDIADPAARRRLLGTRLFYQILTGRNREALATVRAIRALEQKPDAKLLSEVRYEALLRARLDTGTSSGAAFEARYATLYYEALAAVPFGIAGTALKELKGRTEVLNSARTAGYIATEVQPQLDKDHAVSGKGADDILWARVTRTVELPLRTASVRALSKVIAANRVEKPDIWATRDFPLTPSTRATPVTVAIWDSGVDTSLFESRLYEAADHSPGNANGLSFDSESRPSSGVLRPLTDKQAAEYPEMLADMAGLSDVRSATDSPAAKAYKAKLAVMSPEQSAAYLRKLNFFGDYGHGTHVAGIAARGNPFIRLAVVRDTEDYLPVPVPPTDELVDRRVALYRTVSVWLKANHIRVVNMSWGDYPSSYEDALAKNGIGKNPAERQAMARLFFEKARAAFVQLLKDNADTLFVTAAGNTGTDNGFDESYPSALTAPNLLVVSATDQAGDETGFTSNGRNVAVSASGYRVVSRLPGGTQMAESGTSMAAPNVVNLAAKLIALRPTLLPRQIITLIVTGATVSRDGRRHNINPKASLRALRARRY